MKAPYWLFKLNRAVSVLLYHYFFCRILGHSMDTITWKRETLFGESRITRVYCRKCDHTFNIYEVPEEQP